jgi:hypothetical protein
MIFVDTSAWFAAFVPNDPYYSDAGARLKQNAELLVTTDYVLDELLTLLKRRGEFERALRLVRPYSAAKSRGSSGSRRLIWRPPGTCFGGFATKSGASRIARAELSSSDCPSRRPLRSTNTSGSSET